MAASLLSSRALAFSGFLRSGLALEKLVPQQVAAYNPRALKLNLKEPYIPDPGSERTPAWQRTERYGRKLYARLGAASGVNPLTLWPGAAQLRELTQLEEEWHPSVQDMLTNIAAKEKHRREKQLAREKQIAANMAKMPKMIADWRKEKQEAKRKLKEEKAKKERLLAEARERFGYALDPRSPKFQEMLAEIEKEEKKKRKLLKRQKKLEEHGATPAAPGTATS